MSRGIAGPLPIAFILAMAAETMSGANANAINAQNALQLGSLSLLFTQAIEHFPLGRSSDRGWSPGNAETKLAQFPNFPNFRNCFAGAWRNC
jgi:hypothetical protein